MTQPGHSEIASSTSYYSVYSSFQQASNNSQYAKSYVTLGKTQLALDYIDLAERHSPRTESVEMLLKVARAEALIYSGDIRNGEPLAVEAAIYTRAHGHYRRLERIYALKRYISRTITQLGKAEQALSEVLEGFLEQ